MHCISNFNKIEYKRSTYFLGEIIMSYDPYRQGGYGATSQGQGDMSNQAGGGANNN